MFKNLCRSFVVFSLILSIGFTANSAGFNKVSLVISGKVSQVHKQGDKWTGYAVFEGKSKDGTRYTGQGNVEIVFTDKTRTLIKQISGQLKGTKGTEEFMGFWSISAQIKVTGNESIIEIPGIDGECN